jgi:hypothetical protein
MSEYDGLPAAPPPPGFEPVPKEDRGVEVAPTPFGPVVVTSTNGAAVAALVLGIASLLFGIFTGIPALIFGIVGYNKSKLLGGKGKGQAITGIVAGSITVGLLVVVLLSVAAGA